MKAKTKFAGCFNTPNNISESFNREADFSRSLDFMAYDDGDVFKTEADQIVVFGNIYNSTPEKVLSDFKKDGPSSFKKLDGEYTLIIKRPGEIIIYRDRHGAGPQVYFNGRFFTSHLIHLLNLKEFTPKPCIEAITSFLSLGYIPAPLCSLEGVNKLPGGFILTWKSSSITTHDLYPFEDFLASTGKQNLPQQEATSKYEELHKSSISERIGNKKSVGLLLSGGYDSGGNISSLRDLYDGDVYSFSIGFKDNPWTELPLAKLLANKYRSTHFEYEIDGSEVKFLPELVRHLGDPFQEGGLMVNHSAMRLAAENGIKPDIILGGDGNDQHFGTASKELALHWLLRKTGLQPFQTAYDKLGNLPLFQNDNIWFRTEFHNRKILNIMKSDNFGFNDNQLKSLLKERLHPKSQAHLNSVPKTYHSFEEMYAAHNYYVDIKQTVNEVILFKASRMAELFGNQLSFPYMSTMLYDYLKLLPRDLKCKGSIQDIAKGKGISKFLHKNYLKSKLPTEITARKKQGGFAPLPIFFKDNDQRRKINRFILNSPATNELFRDNDVADILQDYDAMASHSGYWFWNKQVKAFQIFNLLVLAVWWEVFINHKAASSLDELF